MNNRVEIRGEVAVIFIPRERGKKPSLECLIDLEDLPKLQALPRSISASWHPDCKTFYCYCPLLVNGKQKNLLIHRLVTDAPQGTEVDHIHHDGLDNRKSQLRVGTKSSNMLNRRGAQSNNRRSGIRGVRWDRNGKCWSAFVHIQGEHHHIGQFDSIEIAAKAVSEYRVSEGCLS